MKMKTRILSLLLAAVFCMSLTQAAFCLAEENQPDRDSIYQVALLQSLAQGHFDGITTVASLDRTPGFELMLPEDDADFQSMDLGRNMDEAIHRAETATSADNNSGTEGTGDDQANP